MYGRCHPGTLFANPDCAHERADAVRERYRLASAYGVLAPQRPSAVSRLGGGVGSGAVASRLRQAVASSGWRGAPVRAFVTGVAGFIGSRLATRLLADGHEVVGVDALTDYYDPAIKRARLTGVQSHSTFTFVEADLLADGWQDHLDGVEVVFHQAAQPGVRASWAEGFEGYAANNVLATQRLLEAVRGRVSASASGDGTDGLTGAQRLRRLVYASSSSVYGDAMTFPTPESVAPSPFSPYGVTKLAAEHLCGVYARNWGVPTVSLRYFTVYGGGQRPDMALHRMIAAARGGPAFPLFGDGTQRRDFTHVDDIVAANLAAVDAEVAPGEVVNIAGGSEATVNELLELVAQVVGSPVQVDQRPGQAGDVRRTGGETSKARELLGWEPRVSLRDGVAEQAQHAARGT